MENPFKLPTDLAVGAKLIAVSNFKLEQCLTIGKTYTCLHGLEGGFFANRPFVTVVGDDDEEITCFPFRFIEAHRLPEWNEIAAKRGKV